MLASYQVYKKKKKPNQIQTTTQILLKAIPYSFCGLIGFIYLVKSFAKNRSRKIKGWKKHQCPMIQWIQVCLLLVPSSVIYQSFLSLSKPQDFC